MCVLKFFSKVKVVGIGLALSCQLNAASLDCASLRAKPIDRITNYIISGSIHLAEELSCQHMRSEREQKISNDSLYVRDRLSDIKFRATLASQVSNSSLSTFEIIGVEIDRNPEGKYFEGDSEAAIDTVPGYISR